MPRVPLKVLVSTRRRNPNSTPDFFLFQGSVFFALPDGNGLLYNVTGNAEGPKPINNLQREVPCKTPYTEMLTVTNWLRRPQRFDNLSCFMRKQQKSPYALLVLYKIQRYVKRA